MSSLNHSAFIILFFLAVLHISMVTAVTFSPCVLWMTHVDEKTITCGKCLVLYMSQYTVYCIWVRSWYKWDGRSIDLALTMKELLYVVPSVGACFYACGLAGKVGWLVENDYRAAITKCYGTIWALWLQLANVNNIVSYEMECILVTLSQVNKMANKKRFLNEATGDLRMFRVDHKAALGLTRVEV